MIQILLIISLTVNALLAGAFIYFRYKKQNEALKANSFCELLSKKDLSFSQEATNEKSNPLLIKNLLTVCSDLHKFVEKMKFNMTQNEATVDSLKIFSNTFSQTSMKEAATMEQLSASVAEIFAVIETISHSITYQNNKMIDISVHVGEHHINTEEVQNNLNKIKQEIDLFSTELSGGVKIIREANTTMQAIGRTMEKINEITPIINDISDRTGLLSLNASIEAARAGEAGRGFAVVANEISRLAESTVNSVKEIETVVKDAESNVLEGTKKVKFANQIFDNIFTWMKDFELRIVSIDEKLHQLTKKSQDIASDVEKIMVHSIEIGNSSSEHKAAVQEVSKISESMASDAEVLSMSSYELLALSDELMRITDIYKHMIEDFKLTA